MKRIQNLNHLQTCKIFNLEDFILGFLCLTLLKSDIRALELASHHIGFEKIEVVQQPADSRSFPSSILAIAPGVLAYSPAPARGVTLPAKSLERLFKSSISMSLHPLLNSDCERDINEM